MMSYRMYKRIYNIESYFLVSVLVLFSFCQSGGWLSSSEKLDPDLDSGECTADRCNGHPETQGFTRPRTGESVQTSDERPKAKSEVATAENNAHQSDTREKFPVAEKQARSLWMSVTGWASDVCSQTGDYFSKKAANITNNFAETVRSVFHEEMFRFTQSLGERIKAMVPFDDPLRKIFEALGKKTLRTLYTIIIILACVLFSYLSLCYFSFLFILAFDSSMFLLYQFMGPEWIFEQLFWIAGYIFAFLQITVAHPYISCAATVALFIASIAIPVIRWLRRKGPKQQISSIEGHVIELHKRVKKIEERQKEMLEILRALKRANGTVAIEE